MTENVTVGLSYNIRGQNEISAHLQDMPSHIQEYHLSTPKKVDVVEVTNFIEKKKRRFSTLNWPRGLK